MWNSLYLSLYNSESVAQFKRNKHLNYNYNYNYLIKFCPLLKYFKKYF